MVVDVPGCMVGVLRFSADTVQLCGYLPIFLNVSCTGWPFLIAIVAGTNANSLPVTVIIFVVVIVGVPDIFGETLGVTVIVGVTIIVGVGVIVRLAAGGVDLLPNTK